MTIPHHYSMKWDNYHSHVGDIFSQLLETGSMADVILYAEGEKINCHKMLLSACSPYFQEILSTAGTSNTIVVVSGIHGEDVRSIIEFVYRGEISVKADRFNSVLKAAEALKICGLMEVSSHLSEMDDSETVCNNSAEKDSKNYMEESNRIINPSDLNVKDHRKNETMVSSLSGNPWNCIEMPLKRSGDIENDKNSNCNIIKDGNRKNIVLSDNSVNDNSKHKVVSDIPERVINTECNDEVLKMKMETNSITDTPTKSECVGNSEDESFCEEIKLKRRKDIRKKLYSEDAMLAALDDMKSGKNLVEAAAKHHVPRTTLYMRARAIGACPAMVRKGYPREKINAALECVAGGSSLQCAATEFGIPKTVLWRRVQKEIGNITPQSRRIKSIVTPHSNPKETVLQDGVSITRVSPQYQIPKATLFRWEKVQLAGEMKLPKTFMKGKTSKQEVSYKVKLDSDASDSNAKPGFLQESASDKFRIKKSALWGSIQNKNSSQTSQQAVFLKNENGNSGAVEELKQQESDQQSTFHFSEGLHELPVSYVNDTQFTDSSIVILAPVENKYATVQEEQNEKDSGPIGVETDLPTLIKVEVHDNHADGSKCTNK